MKHILLANLQNLIPTMGDIIKSNTNSHLGAYTHRSANADIQTNEHTGRKLDFNN